MVGYTELFFSKKDQGARTPSGLLKQLKEMFLPPGVRFWDPVPHGWSPTNNTNWDALRDPWKDFNFINPPFDQTGKFFQRAIAQEENCVSFFLVPCRFHTRYFYKAAPHMKHIYLIKNKINFVGYKVPLPIAMCVVVFGEKFQPVIQQHKQLTQRPQQEMYLYSLDNGSTMEDLIKQCPAKHFEIGNQVSKPLHDVIVKFAPKKKSFGITMPSRLENKVIFDSIVMNPDVIMIFFNPTMHTNIGKLFNGSVLALFYGAIPRNKEFLTTLKIPITVIISIDTTHSEEELATAIDSPLSEVF
jgi:hypothetical protein